MHQASTHTTRTSTWRDERAHALPHSTTKATYAKATYAKLRSDDWRAPLSACGGCRDSAEWQRARWPRMTLPCALAEATDRRSRCGSHRDTPKSFKVPTGAVLQSPDRCGVSASRAMMRGARLVPCLVRCRLVCGAAIRAHALLPYSLHLLQLRLFPSPLEHHRLAPLLAVLEEALRRRGLNQSH